MRIKPKELFTGTLLEWDDQRGFGFVGAGAARVFLHRRDFAAIHKRPEIGDSIQFSVGLDARGRTCATNATHVNDGGRITAGPILALACLLAAPLYALIRRGIPLSWIAAFSFTLSAIAYIAYASDKRRAKNGDWRISEKTLHFLELLGGWPGAYLAQRQLRHKISKTSYQIIFWLIVFAYQYAAVDSLLDWKLTRTAMTSIEHRLKPTQ